MSYLKKSIITILVLFLITSPIDVNAYYYNIEGTSAGKLFSLGLMSNISADELNEQLSRAVGIASILKSLGYNQEYANEYASTTRFYDLYDGYEWLMGYAEIAYDLGITTGTSYNMFSPSKPITKREFLCFQLRALGYDTIEAWSNCEILAYEAGLINSWYIVDNGIFTKREAADIIYSSLQADMQDGYDGRLIDKLIDNGVVDIDDAVKVGLAYKNSYQTDSLKQFTINIDSNYDKSEIDDEDNYDFEGIIDDDEEDIDILDIDIEGNVLTILLEEAVDDGTEGNLVIDRDVFGKKVTYDDIEFDDNEDPEIISVEATDDDEIKITFSEPIDFSVDSKKSYTISSKYEDEFEIEIDGDEYDIKKIVAKNYGREIEITTYDDFDEDDPIEIIADNGIEDYAGNIIRKGSYYSYKDYENDEEDNYYDEPYVIDYEKVAEDEVTLIFNEDIKLRSNDVDDFYHTKSKYTVDVYGGKPDIDINGNEMTLYFTDHNFDEGSNYVYIDKYAIESERGVKNTSVIKTKIFVNTVYDEDDEPEVLDIDIEDEDEIKITFSKKLDEDIAEDEYNYYITDEDNDEVEIDYIRYKSIEGYGIVTIYLYDDLDEDEEYEIEIFDIEDTYGNKMDDFEDEFTYDDDNDDELEVLEIEIEDEDEIKITFSKKLDKDIAEDDYNYYITDEDNDEVEIDYISYKKSGSKGIVTIHLDDDLDEGEEYEIEIFDIEDIYGNKMDDFEDEITFDDDKDPYVKEVLLEKLDYKEYEILVIFSEPMSTSGNYGIDELSNYTLYDDSTDEYIDLDNVDDDIYVDIDVDSNKKEVTITIEGMKISEGNDKLVIWRVEDKAGNKTDSIEKTIEED